MLIPAQRRAVNRGIFALMSLFATVTAEPLAGSLVAQPAAYSRHTVQQLPAKNPVNQLVVQDSTQVYQEYQVDEPVTAKWSKVVYPPGLKAKKIGGTVILQFIVDSTGHIEKGSAHAVRATDPAFTAAVMAVLPTGRLTPAVRGEKRVRQVVEQAFVFAVSR